MSSRGLFFVWMTNVGTLPKLLPITFQVDFVKSLRYLIYYIIKLSEVTLLFQGGTLDKTSHILLLAKSHVPFIFSFHILNKHWANIDRKKKKKKNFNTTWHHKLVMTSFLGSYKTDIGDSLKH